MGASGVIKVRWRQWRGWHEERYPGPGVLCVAARLQRIRGNLHYSWAELLISAERNTDSPEKSSFRSGGGGGRSAGSSGRNDRHGDFRRHFSRLSGDAN